jgi:hypothetical protein
MQIDGLPEVLSGIRGPLPSIFSHIHDQPIRAVNWLSRSAHCSPLAARQVGHGQALNIGHYCGQQPPAEDHLTKEPSQCAQV